MAKKSLNLLYLIGCILIAAGFCLPLTKIGPISGSNGFAYIGGDIGSTIGALLLIGGAVIGIVFSLISNKNGPLLKLIGWIAALAGFLILFGTNSELGFRIMLNIAYIGLYAVVAGIVLAIVGYFTGK